MHSEPRSPPGRDDPTSAPQNAEPGAISGETGSDTSQEEIEAREATHRAPREPPAGFEPLRTCPKDQRGRWERRASRAHDWPMSAITLKCLDCGAWYYAEAKRCEIQGCPLWAFNRRIFG